MPGVATTSASATPTSAPAPTSTCQIPAASAGKVRFAGVNIAGFDFGCSSDGTCSASGAWPPLTQYYGNDGEGQMQHFVNNDGFNVFRLPVGWQFLTDGVLGGTIDEDNFVEYDALVQACLNTGASCIIDIHNYARWNTKVGRMCVGFAFVCGSLKIHTGRSSDRVARRTSSSLNSGPAWRRGMPTTARSFSECKPPLLVSLR